MKMMQGLIIKIWILGLILTILLILAPSALAQGGIAEFQEFQSIPTNGGFRWEYFTIANEHYLAVANFFNGTSYAVDSKIYRWNGTNFAEFQSIPTRGAKSWEFFTIGNDHYLAVTHHYDNATLFNQSSKIYRWNGASFVDFQSIASNGAQNWQFFTMGSDHYLLLSNFNTPSKVYKWNGASFVDFQSIPTVGAGWIEAFTLAGNHYLAINNHSNGANYNIDSKIYKWNGANFAEFQSIPTSGSTGVEFFTIGNTHYLAIGNSRNGSTTNLDSKVYRWNGTSFVNFQSIATNNVVGIEFSSINESHYLAVYNYGNGSSIDSKIYKWDGSKFVEFQALLTNGGIPGTFFTIGSNHYLTVSNNYNGTSYNLNSKIYKAVFPPSLSLTKTVNQPKPAMGEVVTYTLKVSNSGELSATQAIISDTLSANLSFVGPVQMEPSQPGAVLAASAASLPTVASGVTILPGQAITLTLPVRVNPNLADGTIINNTASVTSTNVAALAEGSIALTVTEKKVLIYLPMIIKCDVVLLNVCVSN